MTPIWPGPEPLVIGTYDDSADAISEKIVVQPGEEIPPRAIELIRKAGVVYSIPQDDPGDENEIKRAMRITNQ